MLFAESKGRAAVTDDVKYVSSPTSEDQDAIASVGASEAKVAVRFVVCMELLYV